MYGLNIKFMEMNFVTKNNNQFSVEGHSKGLLDIFVQVEANGETITNNNKVDYKFHYQKKSKERTTLISFQDQQVVKNIAVPPRSIAKNIIPIQKEDLMNVVDPLSSIYYLLFNQKNNLSCNKQIKVFDGSEVYSLSLSLLETKSKRIHSSKLSYQGSLSSCRLSYKTISGHEKKDEKKLNKMYVDIYFGKTNKDYIPYYLTNKSGLVTLKMFLRN